MSGHALPASVRHGYGFAALAIAIANTAVMFFLLKYLVDGAGLSPVTAGSVLLVGKLWDAVVDPIIGRLTDKTRTSWGSRRPWIAFGSGPFVLLFAGLWWGLPFQGFAAAAVYSLMLVAYNTSYSAVVVPYGAMTPALTEDYDERTRLNAARMGWSMVGGLVAGVGLPVLLDQTGGSWRIAGVVLACGMVVPLMTALWATRGRDRNTAGEHEEAMWSVLGNRAFRRTAALFLAAWTSIAVLSALIPFYVEHHLRHPKLLDTTFACIQLSALASIPLAAWLAGRVEKHVAYAILVGSWAVAMLGLAAIPAGTGAPALIVAVLAGPGVAAAHVLPWSMLPDVVEHDRAERGTDRAGAFYGVMTFLEQGATAVALWGLGIGLEIGGYVEGAAAQPESAREAIRWLIGPIPALVLLCAAVGAWMLPPITRAAHRDLVARLARGASAHSGST